MHMHDTTQDIATNTAHHSLLRASFAPREAFPSSSFHLGRAGCPASGNHRPLKAGIYLFDVLQPCASRDGRQHGEQDYNERALDPLLVPALYTRPGDAVNMLTEGRLCKRHTGAASTQHPCSCARHCRLLCQRQPQSFQILRAACAQPAAHTVAG